MKIYVIQPPLLQINSPYPSGAYLSSFFKAFSNEVCWNELNIELFHSIFCREGVEKIFALSEKNALLIAEKAEKRGEEETAFNIRRYISTKESWINWMDFITGVLCGNSSALSTREKEHEFLFSPFAPRGARMENYFASLERNPTIDDVRFLCSLALADFTDYINYTFDKNFSLIRYAEHLSVDSRDFGEIEKELNSTILENFYKPLLIKKFGNLNTQGKACKTEQNPSFIFCISSPFAGTYVPSLFTARFLKETFGNKAYIFLGGGFVNTDLRDFNDKRLSKYITGFSFDRGYGSYKAFFDSLSDGTFGTKPLYKMRLFLEDKIIEPEWQNKNYASYESEVTAENTPDYSDVDFFRYPKLCDDENPMQRMWSDGSWIKAYIAHGCYWAKCAFCDTKLDYVCGYRPVNVEKLYDSLSKTSEEKKVYGVHFVDEALPPKLVKKFAELNLKNNGKLYYWGNVRFEKAYTKDLAQFLSYGGLGAVSAGLEVATGKGLENINKGTDIQSIVNACAAFKEAGILVHAYMIYGFWNDTPQSIIDSMETLRQFFKAGLLDSAFFHKFVLTKNSTVYGKWEKGLQKDLEPVIPPNAKNNLNFKGEEKFNKFGPGLEYALSQWMHGEKLNEKVQGFFDFQVPSPSVKKDYIESLINNYERQNEEKLNHEDYSESENRLYWLGGKVLVLKDKLFWIYLMQEQSAEIKNGAEIAELFSDLRPEADEQKRKAACRKVESSADLQKQLKKFRGKGLVVM